MTDLPDDGFPETSERREAARQKANDIRERHRKQERRGRVLLKGGIVVAVLVIAAIVSLSILNNIRPPQPGPLNMLSDGIQISKDFTAKQTAALQPGESPVPNVVPDAGEVITIDIYQDYAQPKVAEFYEANLDQVSTWVSSGAATLEIHPIAQLNSKSQGYSTRAANAAACVANYSPNSFFAYNTALLTDLPDDPTLGIADDELISRAQGAGVSSAGSIETCITDSRFASWVTEATERAQAGDVPATGAAEITETPVVYVNGLQYTGAPGDSQSFSAFVIQAAGQTFAEDTSATATPTPTPTESVSPTPSETPTTAP